MLKIRSILKHEQNRQWIILGVLYVAMVLWWFFIQKKGIIDTWENFLFGAGIGLFTLIGGIIGLVKASNWGFFKSAIGKSVTFLSAGLITWALGTLIFAYYNFFLDIAVPYPSIADLAYIFSWPLWTIGILQLWPALGIKYQLKKASGKLFLFLIPLIFISLSYYLLFIIARGGVWDFTGGFAKLFFDLAYPVGDIVILTTIALVYSLSVGYLGGIFKFPVLVILFGFILNFASDFSFSFTTTKESFFVGSWVDLLFLSTMFVISFGISIFDPNILSEKNV